MGGHIEADLVELIAATNPRSILAVGEYAGDVFSRYVATHPECELRQIDHIDWLGKLDAIGTYDLIFVSGVIEHLTKQKATLLMARLRDLHTKRLYVLVPIGKMWLTHASHWESNDLIALGMELVNVYAENAWPLHLYKFDLHSYKGVPEWFNSKYWAHPELWDKC